jgi:hypothetical protein
MDSVHQPHETRHSNSVLNWILLCFLLVAGYFLVMEHKAHLAGTFAYLPYLLLLACPLMHLFMHHGHGGHGGHGDHPAPKNERGEQK